MDLKELSPEFILLLDRNEVKYNWWIPPFAHILITQFIH